jgi:hypothetical protein
MLALPGMGPPSPKKLSRIPRIAVPLSLVMAICGCMVPTKVAKLEMDIPRDATPVVVEAGLDAMNDPANQRRLRALAESPETKAAERELVAGILDGSLAALDDPERAERIGALTSRYASVIIRSMSKDVASDLGPALSAVTRSAVKGAVTEATAPENQRRVAAAISDATTQELGPAMQKVIADNVGPGIAAALQDEQFQRALGETARRIGREVVLGGNEAMAEIEANKAGREQTTLGSIGELAEKGSSIASGVTWVLAAIVVVLGGLLAKLLMQARKLKSQSEEQTAATRLLETRIASEAHQHAT